jgi:L-alanine-DL-glutamate epimerase-like enolase superfamily enzyme
MRRWRWMIENGAVQIVQPDLHYNGGMIRATRVARMAAEAGMPVTLHLSGGDAGYVQMLIFSSFTPNLGAFQEYKGGLERSGGWYEPNLRMKDGAINVPESPGLGITEPEELLKGAKRIAGV